MAEYGNITTRSSVKQSLMEANKDYLGRKSWEQLYGSIDLAKQQQISELQQDYAKDVANAYASAYNQNAAIASSNLGQGYKLSAMESVDDALAKAYETYRSNYLQGVSEAENYASKATAGVTEASDTQTENTQTMLYKPYEYLTWLREQYAEGDTEKDIFLNDLLWKQYMKDEVDEQGNVTGNKVLMSWDELQAKMYDAEGNLTDFGTDFYDKMLNKMSVEQPSLGFNKWLAENDEKLYDWFASANPYDYSYDNRNIGSFKKLVGMKSDDYTYSFIERSGAFTSKELDDLFGKFINASSELTAPELDKEKQKTTAETYKNLTAELKTLTDKLGITKSLEKELGVSMTELVQDVATAERSVRTSEEEQWQIAGSGLQAFVNNIVVDLSMLIEAAKSQPTVDATGVTYNRPHEDRSKQIDKLKELREKPITWQEIRKQDYETISKIKTRYDELIAALIKYKNAATSQR